MRTVGALLVVLLGFVVCWGSLGCSSSTTSAKGGALPSGMTRDNMKDRMMENVNKMKDMKEKTDAGKADGKGKVDDKGKSN